ncbi:response regulator transcription factor [Candidatus Woesearchaeota archaeon]|nr:response regulator transcription factor [Candidatus Woesearchaeota archaeon]MBW3016808.1 response regulator transcription factor [Candidatus Woesearchaeota archaeon]
MGSKKAKNLYYKHVLNLDVEDDDVLDLEIADKLKKKGLGKQLEAVKKIKKEFGTGKPRILVVDDEPHIVNLIKLSLQDDYDVLVANSGNEAIHMVEDERPDLVTLDIMMPGMSGYEVVEEMRKFNSTKNIPVIFLSAKDTLKDMEEGMDKGGDDYMTKPFDPEELLKRVKENLRNGK